MVITHIDIYRYSIPMVPFTIATGTMKFAQNIFIRVHTDAGFYGVGECSAFPMIVGETQSTCFAMAQDFAALWKGKDPLAIEDRMQELHLFTARNSTAKSAFDMAIYDIAAKAAKLPLYKFLGGQEKIQLETDLTIGIDSIEKMAAKAADYVANGVRIIKIKLGKEPATDIARVKAIREAVGKEILLRIDANQGWEFDGAVQALTAMKELDIQFCEQPMRTYNDALAPQLKTISPVPIMADESVFDHRDAIRVIESGGCSYVNIKFSKSSGLLEAIAINKACEERGIACMMGGMLESRLALSAFAHFATAYSNVRFYDMDTCLMGHLEDPVTGGIRYNGYYVELPDGNGLGADVKEEYLTGLEHCRIG
ncbi:mandelate racemase/muconate lactonizing enzyme family protein [Flavihumibacter sp. CACIAM 22H1]|uniref:mandelate racemase/muconate lactonizing enzyme family protein n=1 Tax=Flavihumibacter sp. CACIAM 22H1 TaxID=1812911 RepID=UPI0007A83D84|nr:dipeptide epimerase [Flavihumibacter sp. CACIAM 22H1]KYP14530.1 MAG: dipeptide epimerase [Flavihumibacter sp. CACIAM 22H1]